MKKVIPCYRICVWDSDLNQWKPWATRVRDLLPNLRVLKRAGRPRRDIYVQLRPGKLIHFPLPRPKGHYLKLFA